MNWYMGDGTPDTSGASEDPVKVAAAEMAATTAVFAMQKAQMAESGLGGLVGGAVPSPEVIANFQKGGPANVDPYAGLSRDEKIALLTQLQKSRGEAPSQDSTETLVDTSKPIEKALRNVTSEELDAYTRLPRNAQPISEQASAPDFSKGFIATAGTVVKYLSPEQGAKYAANLARLGAKLRPATDADLAGFQKACGDDHEKPMPEKKDKEEDKKPAYMAKSDGEGSRGGKVIGHTSSGKPIYDTDHEAHGSIESFKKHYGSLSDKDHKDAAALHRAKSKETGNKQHSHAANAHAAVAKHGSKALNQKYGSDVYGVSSHLELLGKVKKSEDLPNDFDGLSSLDAIVQKSQSGAQVMDSNNPIDILSEFIQKSSGGMPTGEPPTDLPTSLREVDGGQVAGVGAPTGAQSPAPSTVASTSGASGVPAEDLQGKTPGEKDLESEAGGQKLQKSIPFVDWDQAADEGEFLRAQLASQLLNKSLDVTIGAGVKRERQEAVEEAQELPSVYFQKGGNTVYVDSEDRRIEKAMSRTGGTTFTQGSQANIGAPVQHESSCPNCDSMVKSYLSSCTECGVNFKGVQYEAQGLVLEKSIAESILYRGDEDISIG